MKKSKARVIEKKTLTEKIIVWLLIIAVILFLTSIIITLTQGTGYEKNPAGTGSVARGNGQGNLGIVIIPNPEAGPPKETGEIR
ncbi:hypothetical protein COU61_00710 [Candidatus Pacearchaeota archaeon CG10_big_fil_rev_8_21_14_0_10_35_13]|nr:MAG: hypothetical protein COU61_00710 [Candidatus Pacearchaeota archaeon CG10_big_fil_rev_8_21_14_0_10_35_13]